MNAPVVVATVLVCDNQPGLDHVLVCLSRQSRLPEHVVVVDNGSQKPISAPSSLIGTGVAVDLIRLHTNLGVGGGHNSAIQRAVAQHTADVVWILEHDTFADDRCLEELLACATRVEAPSVVVTSLVRNNYERRWLGSDESLPAVSRAELRRQRKQRGGQGGMDKDFGASDSR